MNRLVAGWLLACVSTATLPLFAQDASSTPIHTNKTRFRIPFRFDERELQRLGAREVRLFVSTDRGRNWRVGGSTSPAARRFEFSARDDGEYWFAVRTVDGAGQLHPPGPVGDAALRVVVDTQSPELAIRLREVQRGRVELSWQADDVNLDATRLRLEYKEPGSARWQPVSIVPQASGRTAWTVARPGTVSVRGVVGDRAENVGRGEARIAIGGGVVPRDPVPDLRQPVAEGERGENPPRTVDADDGLLIGDSPSRRPSVVGPRYDDPPQPTHVERARNHVEEWPGTTPRPARLVNTRTFSIDYELSDVGPSGVGAVEFFITTNNGTKWWRYGNDEDRRSPFSVTVPDDGTYGFSLRVHSGAGLAADPPQPGDAPDIVVGVDRTAPVATLLGVDQGRGADSGRLRIRWNVREANPADKSVSLSYAGELNGRWIPVTDWIADRGEFDWQVPPNAPPRLHLRLTVRDAAGNVSQVRTEQPVVVDLTRPTARIVNVKPTGSTGN